MMSATDVLLLLRLRYRASLRLPSTGHVLLLLQLLSTLRVHNVLCSRGAKRTQSGLRQMTSMMNQRGD